jgi:uncharacterized membrane protein YkvA (DUF1232 family)
MSRPGEGGPLRRNYNTMHYLIHAPNFIRLFWRLLKDPRVSIVAKLPLLIGAIYFVFPFDAIPDFPLVGLGWIDDAVVLYLGALAFIKLCPRHVVAEHVRLIDEGG